MSYPPLTIAQTDAIKNALLEAAADGGTKVLRTLVHFGANPNSADDEGCTAVYMAAEHGHTETVRALVELGADVNTADEYGCTPVWVASFQGHTETVRALVEYGADVNKADNTGCTPLHNAVHHDNAHNDNTAMIWTLVREGVANIASLNRYEMNARDLALTNPGSIADKVLQWLEDGPARTFSTRHRTRPARTFSTRHRTIITERKRQIVLCAWRN
jgi:ankyrin repeat protein